MVSQVTQITKQRLHVVQTQHLEKQEQRKMSTCIITENENARLRNPLKCQEKLTGFILNRFSVNLLSH